ncbi:hypothetical protein HYH02_000565 [Chlamydomonas schloesseri]|uniref:Casein kinase substrate phosphoprotein PP28 domain-containing protein n=1 Tax=Chlamydomonas schloesseri TaxID=2026947 RepID=A0A835WX06_9CHLO|nr:hypothetical protein HYH02_000565 [Chlamydomonas schloesseri]|eukprot:KAG2454728.1 hypothetical protein HYH02_000565 [Chlamydomonas schloesseri]
MGKSRGGKYSHKGRGPRKGADEEEEGSDEEEVPAQRPLGQRANVGMMPPSDSEEEEEGEEGGEGGASSSKPAEAKPAGGQSKTAGKMPPSDSGEDDDDDDDDDSDDDPTPEYLRAAPPRKKAPVEEPRSEEQVRKDLERLEMIKKKREDDRLKRIAQEGWDRYAPVSDTNRPPGSVPTDHPSKAK